MKNYREAISILKSKLGENTLSDLEKQHSISSFDYIGVGYGYNLKKDYPKNYKKALKDIETPLFDKIEQLVETGAV